MKMRGRNGKWLGAGNWRAVREVRLDIVFKFRSGIGQGRGQDNALIVVDIVER